MVEEDPKRDEDAAVDEDGEDRAVILARRRLLVATAMVGIATGAEACDWLHEKLGGRGQPCLNVAPPQPCLDMPPPQPCLETPSACLQVQHTVPSQPCLMPRACLDIVLERDAAPPQPCLSERPTRRSPSPQPCLEQASPQVCLEKTLRKQDDDDA